MKNSIIATAILALVGAGQPLHLAMGAEAIASDAVGQLAFAGLEPAAPVAGDDQDTATEGETRRYVIPYMEREIVHESVLRLLELRRTQARADITEFWKTYTIQGAEETLAKTITLQAGEATLHDVLTQLAKDADTQFETTPDVDRLLVSIDLVEVPFPKALRAISEKTETIPVYDRFTESYIILNLRVAQRVTEVEDFAVPVRYSDPAAFLAFARELGLPVDPAAIAINADNSGYLYTGGVEGVRELRAFLRDFDRRPPPEGEQYTHTIIEMLHQSPRGIVLELWRTFHGNFAARDNKLGLIITPRELDAARQRIAEYDQAPEEAAETD